MTRYLYTVAATALTAVAANAEVLYFSGMPSSIPGNYTVYSFNTANPNAVTTIGTALEESYTAYDFVSGAALCGDVYYTSAVDVMIDWGLGVMDVSTGETKVFNIEDLDSNRIIHNIYCSGLDDRSLVTVQSTTTGEFSAWNVNLSGDSPSTWRVTQTKIGDFDKSGKTEFYPGTDTIFAATYSLTNEIYASFSNEKHTGGFLDVMNMQGDVKSYDIAGLPGYPYSSFPMSHDDTQFKGLINDHGVTQTATFTLDGGNVSISDTTEANDLYTGSQPWQYSPKSDKFYAVTSPNGNNGEPQEIRVIDAKTLKVEESFSATLLLGPGDHSIGAVAVKL